MVLGDEGRWVVGWKTAEMGDEDGNQRGRSFIGTDRAKEQGSGGRRFFGGYRGGSRSGTMRVFPPGTAEKPRTEVRAFLDRIWRT